jgi:Ca2+-binding EF-hand superfamily protein
MANFSESDIREAFQTFDRDGNGFIGASDIHNTYLAMNENLNDDEVTFDTLHLSFYALRCWQVDELIRMVDKDGDGQVSYEEFRKMVHDFNKKAGGK